MRQPFDYVMVQVVPRVERDERLNVCVILFCPTAGYLGCLISGGDVADRLRPFAGPFAGGPGALDLPAVERQLAAIRTVCAGAPGSGPIGRLGISERFHWLASPRSTVVQTSPAHVGLCEDPASALARLFEAQVELPKHGDAAVRRDFRPSGSEDPGKA